MATRRRRREAEGSLAVILLSSLVILLVIAGLVWAAIYYWQNRQKGKLDADLCPLAGPAAATVFLFDFTDPVSSITQADLKNEFQKAVLRTKPGELVEAYVLTGEEGKLRPTFRGCNPGDGADESIWTANPAMLKKRWEDSFEKPLDEAMKDIGTDGGAERSPIMAGIQRIVVERLSKPGMNVPKNLVIASDMIEHTDSFSHYRDGVDYGKFEQSAARDRFRTDLEGVEVRLLAFGRGNSKLDGRDLGEFWARWVEANGGEFDRMVRLSGAN